MEASGFPVGWCNLVMRCVTFITFTGLLLCAEGLTSMLTARGPQFISRGVRVSCHAPWISHLLFADDCLIFTQASKRVTGLRRFWIYIIGVLANW